MKDFNFYAPTRIVFGKESEEKLPQLIQQYGGEKVLVHYGGGSAKRSGLLDKVFKMLSEANIPYVELGGVVPNPLLSKVREGIDLCRKENVNFILAVGGGSVIDSSKAIGYGVGYSGDVWDFWDGKGIPQTCLPIGVILTIPAAGSEMSSSCVITNDEGMLKRGVNSDICRCKFAIMNPERTYTLPDYQTAAGGVDIMMHTMERYFSKYDDAVLTDSLAEALLRTMIEAIPEVLFNPEDYKYRAAIMWASSLSHNDMMECGTEKDFACHKLEHELSGMFGVTHGAGLAAIWCSWAYYVMDKHLNRFAKFAVNVMGVPQDFNNPKETAQRGIRAFRNFLMSIDMPVCISDLIHRQLTDQEIEELVDKCSRCGKMNIGAMEVLTPKDMRAIYEMANE
ncbi:MAG: iron-containing alcohol dehydrogenase [Prevotella sp.]|nr:iron-containing alcohol dehydrogenase [Prevotella sp.]